MFPQNVLGRLRLRSPRLLKERRADLLRRNRRLLFTESLEKRELMAADLFVEDFSDNSAGWTTDTGWSIGSATASSGHTRGNPDPGEDNTPTADNGIAGYVIGGNAGTGVFAPRYLTSPVIDIDVADPVTLEFYRWLNTDYAPFMNSKVEVWNGASWTQIFGIGGSGTQINDNSWNKVLFDVTAYKNANFQVRFGVGIGASGVYNESSWNIDDFSVYTPIDFGDAPNGYPVTSAEDGARHSPVGPTLGATRDGEGNGVHSADASADGADEDGVTSAGLFFVGQTTDITINVQGGSGFVNAWVDLNRDNDWDDAGEHFLNNFAVIVGNNTIPFSIPNDFTPGDNPVRYRLTSASVASPSPTGELPDGEVEDYVAAIYNPGLVVTTNADGFDWADGLTSLHEAIAFANSNPDASAITFGNGASLGGTNFTDAVPDTISLSTSGELTAGQSAFGISTNVTIVGPTAGLTLTNTVQGGDPSSSQRLFYIGTTGNLTLENLTLTGGKATGGGGGGGGAGLGGAIFNQGSLTLKNSTLTNNSVVGGHGGAGVFGNPGGGMGGNSVTGTFADPVGTNGGFGGGGGSSSHQGGIGGFGGGGGATVTANNDPNPIGGLGGFGGGGGGVSPLATGGFGGGNAGNGAGGGGGMGGAIFNLAGNVTIINSTFTQNSATGGPSNAVGGSGLGGALFNVNGSLTLINNTFTGNTVAGLLGEGVVGDIAGGALYSLGLDGVVAYVGGPTLGSAAGALVTLHNNIFANSVGGSDIENNNSTFTGGNNLATQSTGLPTGVSSTTSAALLLGALKNNGGPTATIALGAGSAALDAGSNANATIDGEAGSAALATDQRGAGYVRVYGGTVDIGATEYQLDFGDALNGYPVTLAEDGARHVAAGPRLGATRDSEADGAHSTNADADGADEDGVTAAGPLVVGGTTNITINVQGGSGFVNAWADLNRNGSWEPAEQFLVNLNVVVGDNTFPFTVPDNFTAGDVPVRYRLTSAVVALPSPNGLLSDGEVEDYIADIQDLRSLVVTTADDIVNPFDSLTSLREAVAFANTISGTVTFDPALTAAGDAVILLSQLGDTSFGPSALSVSGEVTIQGPTGSNGITIARDVQAAADGLRLFIVQVGGELTLRSLTLADGLAQGGDGNDGGGGALGAGGAIVNKGQLLVYDSLFVNNVAHGGNGAPNAEDAGGGGGMGSDASGRNGGGPNGGTGGVTATNGGFGGGGGGSNGTGGAGGFGGGGGAAFGGSGGTGGAGGFGAGGGATGGLGSGGVGGFGGGHGGENGQRVGGGGAGLGGAIFNYGVGNLNNFVKIFNSTFADNSAIGGTGYVNGGGYGGAIFTLDGSIRLKTTTIAENTAASGGGAVYLFKQSPFEATLNLDNTILANSIGPNDADANYAADAGFTDSIVETTAIVGIVGLTVDPLLAPLADNGGPTQTFALLPGSPALNAGDDGSVYDNDDNTLDFDQRGPGFPRFVGTVDIGAFESSAEAPSLVVTTNSVGINSTDGLTSLHEALAYAAALPGADVITFGDGSALGGTNFLDAAADSITSVANGLLFRIASDVTIQSPGFSRLTIDGSQRSSVFYVEAGVTAEFIGLTIVNGAADGGGGVLNDGTLTIRQSTLSGNFVNYSGSAIYNRGTLLVVQSTISGNSHRSGSEQNGAISAVGPTTIVQSTITDNSSGINSGDGMLTLLNSIVAGNDFDLTGADVSTALNNLISDPSAAGGIVHGVNGNIVGKSDGASGRILLPIAEVLNPLADNGGTTQTHALVISSPAINAANASLATTTGQVGGPTLTTDQRGSGFARNVGAVDIGAFEFQAGFDFGDAPTGYPVTLAEDGARHVAVGPTLGALRDSEADGAHSADASADGADDADGITAAGPLVVGQTTNIVFDVQGGAGFLNAWIDLNQDNDWNDLGEQFFLNIPVSAGSNPIPFPIPAEFVPGNYAVRVRLTSQSVASPVPTGALPDGEVSDFITPVFAADFGDAPTGYPVTLAENGAYHLAVGPTLGATRDGEADGAHSVDALADGADEDGVTAAGPLVVGQTTNITINVQGGTGFVNAWADLNRDSDWNDPGEQFLTNLAVGVGGNSIPFSLPNGFPPGNIVVRYRLTSASVASPSPTGILPDGEVEDYTATIYSAPQITTNTLTISEGAAVVLSAANINTTDPDNTPAEWTYTASGVTHGQFELVTSPGVAVTSFTQAQINAGAVRFVHEGDVKAPTYSLTVSDGSFTSAVSPAVISFSFEGWVFEAESDLAHQLGVAEGEGWKASVPDDAAGYLTFGPYSTVIDSGVYSAAFRLKILSAVAPEVSVARIDVWDQHAGRQLAVKVLRGGDFAAVGVYQDFKLQFEVDNDDALLEFRTYWFGTVGLEEDRVRVRYAMTDYEAETDLGHLTGSAAGGGWQATAGTDVANYLAYGPYVSDMEPGHYTANFRLQIGAAVDVDTIVATIDVWDFHAGKSLSKKVLHGGDFAAVGMFQDFKLQFEAADDSILEFRTYWYGFANLNEDRVRVVPIPIVDFEAESELAHQVGAASGDGWTAAVATDTQGYLAFGPYATEINAGAYSATFRLQVGSAVDAATPVATIDVWDNQVGERLASKLLYARDFAAVSVYQEFALPFNLPDDDSMLEFRTYWYDTVNLKEDRVRVAPRADVRFEAELDLVHQIGRAEGRGWAASVALDSPAYLAFGPYTSDIGPGTYAAAYRLAVNGAASPGAEVAVIDVWDNHAGVSLARRSILRGDFDADNVYQTFGLAFEVASDDALLEFRTYWTDTVDLNEDGVRIVPLEPLQFEAESDLAHHVGHGDGDGWRATVAADNAGYLTFGPYTSALDAGNFTASYRLQVSGNPAANSAVATIDVWDATRNTALAGRTLTRQDFAAEGVYQDFELDFVLPDSDDQLEFRTQFADAADLKQDRVRIVRALDDLFATLDW